jgi:molybdopterin synthase sulfur carrier subunit
MPRVSFTHNLQRHVACPTMAVSGSSVAAALAAYFAQNPRARDYVLDEQGAVRHHVAVFVRGELVQDRRGLSDPVGADDEIYVMQALSGG